MGIHFLFPSHPIRSTVVDEMFAEQVGALANAGFTTSLCTDAVLRGDRPLRGVPVGATVVYRGWMLNAAGYGRLTDAIVAASAAPLTSLDSYLAAHHLPNWYPLIRELTPETYVLSPSDDGEAVMRSLGWGAYFVKDFVKSLKTDRGSIVRDAGELRSVIADMECFRGEIEGGLCLRRVEPFEADTERRYFVLDGVPFSPSGSPVPGLVTMTVGRIPSRFYSVDVIRRTDGVMRIVEIGDGQVSDLTGWDPVAFANMWLGPFANR